MIRVKRVSWLIAAVALLSFAAGCGGDDGGGDGGGGGDDRSFDVGLIAPQTGATASLGAEVEAGFRLALEDASTDGYEFTPRVEDEGAESSTAVASARKLISEGVENIAGLISSADCFAVAPVVDQLGGTLVSSTCAYEELNVPEPIHPSFFAMAAGDARYSGAFARILGEEFPSLSRLGIFAWDFPSGREQPQLMAEAFEADGMDVQLAPEEYVPIQTTSYRSQIAKMASEVADVPREEQGIAVVMAGAAVVTFIQQAEAFGLLDDVSFIGGPSEAYLAFRVLEGNVPEYWSSYDYFWSAESENEARNDSFVERFNAETGENPSGLAWQGYAAGAALGAALKEAGTDDPEAVQQALTEVTVPTATGDYPIDPTTHRLQAPVVVAHIGGDESAEDGVELIKSFSVPAE